MVHPCTSQDRLNTIENIICEMNPLMYHPLCLGASSVQIFWGPNMQPLQLVSTHKLPGPLLIFFGSSEVIILGVPQSWGVPQQLDGFRQGKSHPESRNQDDDLGVALFQETSISWTIKWVSDFYLVGPWNHIGPVLCHQPKARIKDLAFLWPCMPACQKVDRAGQKDPNFLSGYCQPRSLGICGLPFQQQIITRGPPD